MPKLVRCIIPPAHVDAAVGALKALGVSSLCVFQSGGWLAGRAVRTETCRGLDYEVILLQEAVIDGEAADHLVDDVGRLVMETCGAGPGRVEGRILVVPLEASYDVRTRRRLD